MNADLNSAPSPSSAFCRHRRSGEKTPLLFPPGFRSHSLVIDTQGKRVHEYRSSRKSQVHCSRTTCAEGANGGNTNSSCLIFLKEVSKRLFSLWTRKSKTIDIPQGSALKPNSTGLTSLKEGAFGPPSRRVICKSFTSAESAGFFVTDILKSTKICVPVFQL